MSKQKARQTALFPLDDVGQTALRHESGLFIEAMLTLIRITSWQSGKMLVDETNHSLCAEH